ncbi:pentapeptide repeat-containing protein [Micromonospora sp. WMMD967]|uniref:pentapeptide repeat-containing protein n=1 Tax=Micromonospora sp. WMMD967 TaxID=3016101 RepID=UPI002416D141|nr:pentapeptide repeat-containing protein [Micromonospora sp. WMMD967]MDG4835231.1 pentapeptide repeat-containing protein [Micromonospora sp. WMMD967]
MAAGAFWYAGWPSVRRDSTVTPATLFDLLKLVFSVVAGVGGVAALVVAYRRQRVAEHANKLAEFAHGLAHAADLRADAAEGRAKTETDRNGIRLFNERFAKASEQLGSDKAAVRLAGVYAMAGLADDWRDGRQTCIDVLCAYLRMPYTPPAEDSSDVGPTGEAASTEPVHGDPLAREEREVRHTVIRLISRHLRLAKDEPTSWRGLNFDFTGAVFDGGDFSEVTFSGGEVSFADATFCGRIVSFTGATFSGGGVSFAGATFSSGRVFFAEATFSGGGVSFYEAKFSGGEVFLAVAKFSGGNLSFDRATFSGGAVFFSASTFSGAKVEFGGAMFSGGRTEFIGTTFSGGSVGFRFATFSGGRVSFRDAIFSGGEVDLRDAIFSGGEVDLLKARIEAAPPLSDSWPDGVPPEGLYLPAM